MDFHLYACVDGQVGRWMKIGESILSIVNQWVAILSYVYQWVAILSYVNQWVAISS